MKAMEPGRVSIAREVNGERLVVLGWPRAVLMQLAHPLIAEGVARHSTFRAHPLAPAARLHATIRAMLTLTFGSEPAAAAAAARINGIHDRVHGSLREPTGPYAAGTPYSAHDPQLLAWVHLTLLDSMPLAFSWLVRPLSTTEQDAYCLESQPGARRLGIPDDRLPGSTAEVAQLMTLALTDGRLAVGREARTLAGDILSPTGARLAWPFARLNRLITVGLLPPILRRAYDLQWTADDQRQLERWAARLRAYSRHAPARLRRFRIARTG
jgi:uncharacterized protein (DUF2236 family)